MSDDQWQYKYQAEVIAGYDGDTITLELKGPERTKGLAARDYLHTMIPVGSKIQIQTIKDTQSRDKQEKYGRYLVEIHTDKGNINDLLVHAGFAEYKTY